MHCPMLWNHKCAIPCAKVDNTFPQVLKKEYITEWVRVTTTVLEIYATPVGGKTV